MKWLIIAGVLISAYGLHRLALWMEAKGWIYYIHKKGTPDALGNAVLNVQKLLQPEVGHVLEVRQSQRVQHEDVGGPDKPGALDRKEVIEPQGHKDTETQSKT